MKLVVLTLLISDIFIFSLSKQFYWSFKGPALVWFFFFPVVLIPFFLVFSVIKVSAVVLFCFFKLKITILVLVLDLFPNMCTQFYKFFSNHCCHSLHFIINTHTHVYIIECTVAIWANWHLLDQFRIRKNFFFF